MVLEYSWNLSASFLHFGNNQEKSTWLTHWLLGWSYIDSVLDWAEGYWMNLFHLLVFSIFSETFKDNLPIKYHIHFWEVSLQLSCGDSCQVWMWFNRSDCFLRKAVICPVEKVGRELTLNVRGGNYLGFTWSISWLLMPWLLTSPGHQQPWYWLCRICGSWKRKDFKCLCHINGE